MLIIVRKYRIVHYVLTLTKKV